MKLSKKKQADLAKKHKVYQAPSTKRWRIIENDMPAERMTKYSKTAGKCY